MRKALSIVLALVLCLGMLPAAAMAVDRDPFVLEVGGVAVTRENMHDVFGDGTVRFDPVTSTLYLSDAVIVNEAGHGIHAQGMDLNIVGEGSSRISGADIVIVLTPEETEYLPHSAICVEGDGETGQVGGGLVMTGTFGDITATGTGGAISAWGDLHVDARVDSITAVGAQFWQSPNAVESTGGNVYIGYDAQIGSITAPGCGISAAVDAEVSGTVDAIAGEYGVVSFGGNVNIYGTVGSIEGAASGIEAYASYEYDEQVGDFVRGYGGSVYIWNAAVRVRGGTYGILAEGDLYGNFCAAQVESLGEQSGCAIAVGGRIEFSSVAVTRPENCLYGQIPWNEFIWYSVVCDSEGAPALTVTLEPAYTVWFFLSPGREEIEEQSIPLGGTAVKPEDPTLYGYIFEGWYTDSSLAPEYRFDFEAPLEDDLWLYAKWRVDETVPPMSAAFTDLDPDKWYMDAVEYVLRQGLMNGTGADRFDPDGTVTRAMLVTILWRVSGEPPCGGGKSGTFVDVPEYQWYTEGVEWAAAFEIVTGYGDGRFGPADPITREQMAVILYRYARYMTGGEYEGDPSAMEFADADQISDWAKTAMCWATEQGIINGKNGTHLDPGGYATRAEGAQILKNFTSG